MLVSHIVKWSLLGGVESSGPLKSRGRNSSSIIAGCPFRIEPGAPREWGITGQRRFVGKRAGGRSGSDSDDLVNTCRNSGNYGGEGLVWRALAFAPPAV